MVPYSCVSMKDEIWGKIALKIIKMLSKSPREDKDFKTLRHNRQYIFSVRRDLIERELIQKNNWNYRLNLCTNFYCKDEVLPFIEFVREGGDNAENGVEYLRKMTKRPFGWTDADLLKFIEKKPIAELRKVVHITNIQELWTLLEEILDGKLQLETKITEKALRIMQTLLEHITFHENQQVLQLRKEQFREKVKFFILNAESKKLTSIMVEQAIRIFREMKSNEEFKLDFVEQLLERNNDILEKIRSPIVTVFFSLSNEKVRKRLINWTKNPNEKLQKAAKQFLDDRIGV